MTLKSDAAAILTATKAQSVKADLAKPRVYRESEGLPMTAGLPSESGLCTSDPTSTRLVGRGDRVRCVS